MSPRIARLREFIYTLAMAVSAFVFVAVVTGSFIVPEVLTFFGIMLLLLLSRL